MLHTSPPLFTSGFVSDASIVGLSRHTFTGGLGPGGLLLATLPLILAPMLSYLFTPMVIPVTATIAAGRRRKRSTGGRDEDDVAFSPQHSSTPPAFALIPRLLSFRSESGSMSKFLPPDSQTATPFGPDSNKTMNLSAARRRDEAHARQSAMSHRRALVLALKKRHNQSVSEGVDRHIRQRQHRRNSMFR